MSSKTLAVITVGIGTLAALKRVKKSPAIASLVLTAKANSCNARLHALVTDELRAELRAAADKVDEPRTRKAFLDIVGKLGGTPPAPKRRGRLTAHTTRLSLEDDAYTVEALTDAGIPAQVARRLQADGPRCTAMKPLIAIGGRKRAPEATTQYIWGPDAMVLLDDTMRRYAPKEQA